jgi:sugar (pentulose or hexulose) kinase
MATAVLDVGKTNLKLLVVDGAGRTLAQRAAGNRARPAPPYLHADLAAIERWLLAALRELGATWPIAAIVVTAHGSSGVLVDEDGPVMPMVDYEALPPPWLDAAYAEVMPPFVERGSRLLGGMAHLGRQLFWLARQWPGTFARARAILTLPQYWAWRLCGVMAAEITSLAAQSHLWDLLGGRPSRLVEAMGWQPLLPPLRPAWERLGPILPRIAAATGLDAATSVLNGMHDSSANLYRYQRAGLGRATLLSTGTWIVGLRPTCPPERLIEARGMTLTADAEGRPVGGVLAMVGRELETLAGTAWPVTDADLALTVAQGSFALPSFVPFDGIFPASAGRGRIVGPPASPAAVALLYGALMAEACLELLGAEGEVVIDGGFCAEPRLARLVAALRPDLRVRVEPVGGGTALGAGLLASHGGPAPPLRLEEASSLELPGLAAYRRCWRELLSEAMADGRGWA